MADMVPLLRPPSSAIPSDDVYLIRRDTLNRFTSGISELILQLEKMPTVMQLAVMNDPKVKMLTAAYAALLAEMK